MEGEKRVRLLIIDDSPTIRQTLARLGVFVPRVEVVGEAANGIEGLKLIRKLRPDVITLDIQMPEVDGFELLDALEGAVPAVIFVTAYDKYALRAFDASAMLREAHAADSKHPLCARLASLLDGLEKPTRDAETDPLLQALGMPVAEGPGEGRFVVDSHGAHAKPAQAPRPVRVSV